MKLRDVFLEAAVRLEAGDNHFCCTSICGAVGWDFHERGIYTCPSARRFLDLWRGHQIGEFDHADTEQEVNAQIMREARASVGSAATEGQFRAACVRASAEILRGVSGLVGDEECS